MDHGSWIVRSGAAVATVAVIIGCVSEPDDATRRFDQAFWHVWFMEMREHDRQAVCWSEIGEMADDYAASFDGGYLRAEERAAQLFARACEPYKEDR